MIVIVMTTPLHQSMNSFVSKQAAAKLLFFVVLQNERKPEMQRNSFEYKIVEERKCSEKRTMPCFSGLCPFCAGVDASGTCGGGSKIGLAHTHTCHDGQKPKLKQLFLSFRTSAK